MQSRLYSLKSDTYTALETYCKSGVLFKPSHYELANALKNKIHRFTDEKDLVDALFQTYTLALNAKSTHLAPVLAKLMGQFFGLKNVGPQVDAYHYLLNNSSTLYATDFLSLFNIQRKIAVPQHKQTIAKDECTKVKVKPNGDLLVFFVRKYEKSVIETNLAIQDPIRAAYNQRQGSVELNDVKTNQLSA